MLIADWGSVANKMNKNWKSDSNKSKVKKQSQKFAFYFTEGDYPNLRIIQKKN